MAIDLVLGTLTYNSYGAAVKGTPSTVISIQLKFEPGLLGYYWSLRNREANGTLTQFAISDPTSSQADQDAFVAAVNDMDLDTYIGYLAPWIAGEINRAFGMFCGPLQLPPRPDPSAGLTNAGNILDRVNGVLVNDWQLAPAGNGLLGLVRK